MTTENTFNRSKVSTLIKSFSLTKLFIEELGWNLPPKRPAVTEMVTLDDHNYNLTPIAEKGGLVVYRCDEAPGYKQRIGIEREINKTIREHLLIFCDSQKTVQIWQWVRRESGKPLATREEQYRTGQSAEPLLQKLELLVISLQEEEQGVTVIAAGERLRRAFDVESVTKKFYERFEKEHTAFLGFIQGIDVVADRAWYASLMLNRLMFIYFIQRKGFMAGDRDYLRHRLQQVQASQGQDQFYSFYRHFLLRLFHEGLGSQARTTELDSLLGKIPYLNGGLFDLHQLEKTYPDIQIPDDAFNKIFDFFDAYQWHLDERPLQRRDEINPDVLGYIFEKYINRKQMGAYYTKEDITGYISQNTIIPYLFEAVRDRYSQPFETGSPLWQLLALDSDRYIYEAVRKGVEEPLPIEIAIGQEQVGQRDGWNRPAATELALPTETWREVVARRQRYTRLSARLGGGEVAAINDLITYNLDIRQFALDAIKNIEEPELLTEFYNVLTTMTVLDPTCGSGAFLFAALNILEPLYEACLQRMESFVAETERAGESNRYEAFRQTLNEIKDHPNRRYFILKSIIIKNLYGVDIMDEAVEIAKLRLFLKLAAQVEPDPAAANYGLEPLPDIDFNVRAGNTLVGFATLAEAFAAVDASRLLLLDYNKTKNDIETKAGAVERGFDNFRRLQLDWGSREEGLGDALRTGKRQLETDLAALNHELDRFLAARYNVDQSNIPNPTKYKAAFESWHASHKPFHWCVEFYGIMKNGGFDVIIGNPPYVEYSKAKSDYTIRDYKSENASNLYAFCMERSGVLLRKKGLFGMIVPAGVLGLDETNSLRDVLFSRHKQSLCSTYSIRPSKLFEGVDQRLCIYFGSSLQTSEYNIWTSRYYHWYSEEREILFDTIEYNPSFNYLRLKRIPQIGSIYAHSVLSKIEANNKKPVESYYAHSKSGFLTHYHRSPRYWIRAMDFEQYFKSATKTRSVHHFRDLYFKDKNEGKAISAVINSSLFFFWFISVGNGRNITGTDVEQFPIGTLSLGTLNSLVDIFDRLMADYKANSFIRKRQDAEFQEFRPSKSKRIIDEIDRVLAQHYGFTDEELDFIINYDIKYRMGREEEGEDEE